MRSLISILFIICYLFSNAQEQEDNYNSELIILEQKLQSISQYGLKIPVYKDIINLSFPDHIDEVLKNSEELLKLSTALNNPDSKAFAFFYLAEYYYHIDNFEKAEEYYNEALLLYISFKDTSQIMQTYHNLGLTNQYINNYDKALSCYQKSIELAESLASKEKAAISYQDIGTLYNDLQKYSLAQYYYEKALQIYNQTNNEERKAAIYQNIGVLHYNWGDFEKSLEYYKKSLRIYEQRQDKKNIAISL